MARAVPQFGLVPWSRTMAAVYEEREGYVERDGVRLHYLERRADTERSPAVLLLHGLGSNARVWDRVAAEITDRRLVMLDQRGHGRSSRPESGYDMERTVADAAHVIDTLALGRPLVVGHSWGGLVALELSATHSEVASALLFVDGPLTAMGELVPFGQAASRLRGPMSSYASVREAEDELVSGLGEGAGDAGMGPGLSSFVRAGLVERRGRFHPTPTTRVRRQVLRAAYSMRPQVRFTEVEGPVLLAMAGRPSVETPPVVLERQRTAAERLLELSAGVRLRWYDSGHQIPVLRGPALAKDIGLLARGAAYADIAWRAASLDGDWNATVHEEDGGWNARELLAHLASTQTAIPQIMRLSDEHRAGEPFDPDRWNASQIKRRHAATPQSLIEELQAASDALPAAIFDADLRRPAVAGAFAGQPLGEMLDRMLSHQLEHLMTLERAFRSRQDGSDESPGLSA